MFERNPVDNRTETLVAIEITLADGASLTGRAVLPAGKGVHKLLEGEAGFVYVESFTGDGEFVPKADIRGAKIINSGRGSASRLIAPDARAFEPYRILGLENGAPFDEIRDAYHRLSKAYHPDRYASVELPPEVRSYLEAMSKSVNAAFQALKHVGQKPAPIYSRG